GSRRYESASQSASFMIVKVGLALPALGKTEALATATFGTSWQCRSGPTTEVEGSNPIRVVPEGCAHASAMLVMWAGSSFTGLTHFGGQIWLKPACSQ